MESNTIELELRVQKRKRKDKLVLNAWCWLFMAAAVIFYILFQGYPIVCSIVYSLLDWSGLTRTARFVGLSNYKELLTDKREPRNSLRIRDMTRHTVPVP